MARRQTYQYYSKYFVVAKVQRPDCQISQLCWHVVPFNVIYLDLSKNVTLKWAMYTWILHDGKDVSWFSEKRVLECEGLQGDNGIFYK